GFAGGRYPFHLHRRPRPGRVVYAAYDHAAEPGYGTGGGGLEPGAADAASVAILTQVTRAATAQDGGPQKRADGQQPSLPQSWETVVSARSHGDCPLPVRSRNSRC